MLSQNKLVSDKQNTISCIMNAILVITYTNSTGITNVLTSLQKSCTCSVVHVVCTYMYVYMYMYMYM